MEKIPVQIAETLMNTFDSFSSSKNEFDSTFSLSDTRYARLVGRLVEGKMRIAFTITDNRACSPMALEQSMNFGTPNDSVKLDGVTEIIGLDVTKGKYGQLRIQAENVFVTFDVN